MKKIISPALLTFCFFLGACKKDNGNNDIVMNNTNNNTTATVRYDFTASMSADYILKATTDTAVASEMISDSTWSKTVTITRTGSATDSAKLTVYPPVAWVGTGTSANVLLKITVNNVVKDSLNSTLLGLDRSAGVTISTVF